MYVYSFGPSFERGSAASASPPTYDERLHTMECIHYDDIYSNLFQSGKYKTTFKKREKVLAYKRIKTYTETSPWCTYGLVHCNTLAPSLLTNDDLRKFPHTYGHKNLMFNFTQSAEMSEAEKVITHLITRLENVLPSQDVDMLCIEMEAVVMKNSTSESSDVDQLHHHLRNLCINIMKKISDLKSLRPISVDKEIQKNAWFGDDLRKLLQEKGFTVKTTFTHNDFSVFGKSKPDICFYRTSAGILQAGICIPEDATVKGAAVEFKVSTRSEEKQYAQTMANMIRMGNDLVIDELKRGSLVKRIKIFGMLVTYESGLCIPFIYRSDLNLFVTNFKIGQEMNFAKFLSFIIHGPLQATAEPVMNSCE